MPGLTFRKPPAGESGPVRNALCHMGKSLPVSRGRTRSRCELSNKPQVSKASPIGQDIKIIMMYNVIVVAAMVGFAILGLSIASAAVGS